MSIWISEVGSHSSLSYSSCTTHGCCNAYSTVILRLGLNISSRLTKSLTALDIRCGKWMGYCSIISFCLKGTVAVSIS